MTVRLGILGGTFDPVHCGHLDIAQVARDVLALDRVLLMVAHVPPHRPRPHASAYHRFAMTALAVSGEARIETSDDELREGGRSYTIDTLRRLQRHGVARDSLYFVLGADAAADLATWKAFPALLDEAWFTVVSRPANPVAALADRVPAIADRLVEVTAADAAHHVATARRGTVFLIDAPTADVSSTRIRDTRRAGRPIDGLVPPLVAAHIDRHHLYTDVRPAEAGDAHAGPSSAGRMHE